MTQEDKVAIIKKLKEILILIQQIINIVVK